MSTSLPGFTHPDAYPTVALAVLKARQSVGRLARVAFRLAHLTFCLSPCNLSDLLSPDGLAVGASRYQTICRYFVASPVAHGNKHKRDSLLWTWPVASSSTTIIPEPPENASPPNFQAQ
jgi:hypothetical protein